MVAGTAHCEAARFTAGYPNINEPNPGSICPSPHHPGLERECAGQQRGAGANYLLHPRRLLQQHGARTLGVGRKVAILSKP
jgi:hypothetical protein